MSDGKRTTLSTLGPTWLLDPSTFLDAGRLEEVFGRCSPRMLDIGVGTGRATVAWAADHPDHDVIAVELHLPGIARLLSDGHAAGLTNVRVIEADVTALVDPAGEAGSGEVTFEHVRVLFPDPWPKKRHVDRRLVDVAFVRRVTDLLAVGGTLHLATDWPPYADQMRAVIAAEPRLKPRIDVIDDVAVIDDAAPDALAGAERRWRSHRPDRPITAYEQRGIAAARQITDLIARRSE